MRYEKQEEDMKHVETGGKGQSENKFLFKIQI